MEPEYVGRFFRIFALSGRVERIGGNEEAVAHRETVIEGPGAERIGTGKRIGLRHVVQARPTQFPPRQREGAVELERLLVVHLRRIPAVPPVKLLPSEVGLLGGPGSGPKSP